jgi:hypothetical protein
LFLAFHFPASITKLLCVLFECKTFSNYVHKTHVQKMKAQVFVTEFYFFKSKGYNIQMQVIMDHRKRFQDVYVGILGSVNGAQILKIFHCPIEPLNRICLLLNLDKKVSNLTF